MMNSFFKNLFCGRRHFNGAKRAETILEVLAAIFVVAIGSAAATSLVIDALRSNGLSRDNLLAMNLAVEGAEAVRAVRDGNWLKFSYDRDNCWNMMPDKSVCNTPTDLIDGSVQGKFYTPYLDTSTMGWKLVKQSTSLDLTDPGKTASNDQYFMLHSADANTSVDSDGDGSKVNDRDIYVAADSTLPKVPSKFYRMITVQYPNSGNPAKEKTMTVTSIVQWNDRGFHQVKLVTKLTNYLKVKVK